MNCVATQEAVIEQELDGEMGCPICGLGPEWHRPESSSGAQGPGGENG